MNKRHTEYIALYLFVFGAILLFGVLARKFVLVKGYDEFSAAVGFLATVVVLSALYISLQMTLNELLLPRMEKFLMRFPAFQKLEEVAVVAKTPAAIVEPIEEDAITEITPQPSQYEVLRANAIAKQERASQAKLESVLDYTKQTMVAYMSEADLDRLCGYITEYSLGDTPCKVSPVSVDSALKSIDLMHFGWNIGKAFGKKRIHTATFIKNVFAHALRDLEISTIERKMSHTESECRIILDNKIEYIL
ncbi:MAG: mobilization protein [Paludibacteraceae bacterium]|nr:mobilization protein [Paludibacteraceae bacterium]MBO5828521.1 mobilization protein [Paludibacteraceae bacterium]